MPVRALTPIRINMMPTTCQVCYCQEGCETLDRLDDGGRKRANQRRIRFDEAIKDDEQKGWQARGGIE